MFLGDFSLNLDYCERFWRFRFDDFEKADCEVEHAI